MNIAIAIVGSGALSALISGIFALINNRIKKNSDINKGMQILLKASIKEDCTNYLQRGSITLTEQEELTESFACYKALGGNGFIDDLVSEVKGLRKEEAK